MTREIRLPCFGITIRLDRENDQTTPGCGCISSELKEPATDGAALLFHAAIDGIEALILAHACAGIDVTAPAYVEGIETAVEAAAHHLT